MSFARILALIDVEAASVAGVRAGPEADVGTGSGPAGTTQFCIARICSRWRVAHSIPRSIEICRGEEGGVEGQASQRGGAREEGLSR